MKRLYLSGGPSLVLPPFRSQNPRYFRSHRHRRRASKNKIRKRRAKTSSNVRGISLRTSQVTSPTV